MGHYTFRIDVVYQCFALTSDLPRPDLHSNNLTFASLRLSCEEFDEFHAVPSCFWSKFDIRTLAKEL